MLFRAFVNAAIEFRARRIQREDANSRGGRRRFRTQRPLTRDVFAGLQAELERALYPRPITRIQLVRLRRIETFQDAMKTFGAVTLADYREPGAKSFVSRRAGEERLAQSSQIESGAAHQQSSMAAGFDLFNLFDRGPRPIRRREINAR